MYDCDNCNNWVKCIMSSKRLCENNFEQIKLKEINKGDFKDGKES